MPNMLWDLYCRVIDNHGDVGVCWRLAADLGARGETVRLWIDDASALLWMAPDGAARVEVRDWPDDDARVEPGDVVIEAFGCELPVGVLRRMAARPRAPIWINLEYLSAEAYVERSHGLPSPQASGPAAGLRKWFYYPGFSGRTGGLIREPDLLERQRVFDPAAWLGAQGVSRDAGACIVTLFCYEQPALAALLEALARRPCCLLAAHGLAARQAADLLGPTLRRGELRALLLPPLTQHDYDHLLWASDLNFVRGEDSFVRAQWAGKPFVWQVYPQHDGAHQAKLEAFLALFDADADADADASAPLGADIGALWRVWNDLPSPTAPGDAPALPDLTAWHARTIRWRDGLLGQADLTTQLLGFVARSR